MYYRNIGWPLFKTFKTKLCDKGRVQVDFTTLYTFPVFKRNKAVERKIV